MATLRAEGLWHGGSREPPTCYHLKPLHETSNPARQIERKV
ncbi:hypothetical protein DB31_2371 [Hyalangium minutum]|uniref:Uncharacterized protein n=1 Tax=Hyalangium minutum TaxID=394096 RepID=A0A085W8E6_9BACT|nr:hypothetical protein DB31_2371 [Hyalangium minutum]